MTMRHLAAIATVSVLCVVPAMAQTNDKKAAPDQPTKQDTQGVPQSLNNPQYGGAGADATATRQQSQGVPSALNNPQYGSGSSSKKQQ